MISKPKTITKLTRDQNGLAAIVVVLIVIVLLTMIVFTFARISQRNQRQVLDRQLDTAAYYAAESGINDAREWIRNNPNEPKDSCANPADWPESELLDGENLSYPCVLVTPVPNSLKYDNVERGKSHVLPVQTSGFDLTSIEFAWQAASGGDNFADCPVAPTNPQSWPSDCSPGILQIDIIPLRKTSPTGSTLSGNINRDYFIDRTLTVFARPSAGSVDENGTVGYTTARGFGNQGATVSAKCNSASSPKHCRLLVSGFAEPGFTPNFAYVKITPHYETADIEVCSPVCGDASEQLIGAQWVVDSTGRAADVLKRLQVRLSAETFSTDRPVPGNAIHTAQTICKRFEIGDGVYQDYESSIAACWLKDDGPILPPTPPSEPQACVDTVTFTKRDSVDGILARRNFPDNNWVNSYTITRCKSGSL
jgi:hypothetical protein